MEFTEDQINRYSRHILLPEVGGKGQKKIAKAKILLVGAGGLGSPAALYLAAAGVGTIGLIDSDVVDLTNLHRQILHHTSDVGRPKVVSGKEKIQALNPDVQVLPKGGAAPPDGRRHCAKPTSSGVASATPLIESARKRSRSSSIEPSCTVTSTIEKTMPTTVAMNRSRS